MNKPKNASCCCVSLGTATWLSWSPALLFRGPGQAVLLFPWTALPHPPPPSSPPRLPRLPAAASATLQPPPGTPTASGRPRPDLPQIIPGVRRPAWWLLPSYTSAPRGRTTFKGLGKRSRGGAPWAAHTEPQIPRGCHFLLQQQPRAAFLPPCPFSPNLHSLPHRRTLWSHMGVLSRESRLDGA